MANHNKHKHKNEPMIELEANTPNRRQARENVCDKQVAIGFCFESELVDYIDGATFFNQSQSFVRQNKSKPIENILKTALYFLRKSISFRGSFLVLGSFH